MLATVVVVAVVTPSWPAPLAGLVPPGPSAEGRGPRPTLPTHASRVRTRPSRRPNGRLTFNTFGAFGP